MTPEGKVQVIEVGNATPDLLTLRDHRALVDAEVLVYDPAVPATFVALSGAKRRHPAAGEEARALVARLSAEPGRVVWLRAAPAPTGGRSAAAHRPAILFLTGLSGSGKSTLALGLNQRLREAGVLATIVDGDVLRTGLCNNLGFSAEDRHENVRRASELALHLADVGAVVIVALISPFRADRARAAERAGQKGIPFAEVFVNAPLPVCEQRDPKNLYKRARAGQIPSFTGIDSPYEAPLTPTLELRTDRETAVESLDQLTALALQLARPATNKSAAGPA